LIFLSKGKNKIKVERTFKEHGRKLVKEFYSYWKTTQAKI